MTKRSSKTVGIKPIGAVDFAGTAIIELFRPDSMFKIKNPVLTQLEAF